MDVLYNIYNLLWTCLLVVLYNMSVAGVHVVEFGTERFSYSCTRYQQWHQSRPWKIPVSRQSAMRVTYSQSWWWAYITFYQTHSYHRAASPFLASTKLHGLVLHHMYMINLPRVITRQQNSQELNSLGCEYDHHIIKPKQNTEHNNQGCRQEFAKGDKRGSGDGSPKRRPGTEPWWGLGVGRHMVNIRLNKAIDCHKSRTVQSPITLWKNSSYDRGGHAPMSPPWLCHWSQLSMCRKLLSDDLNAGPIASVKVCQQAVAQLGDMTERISNQS